MQDHFKVLGVDENASVQDIKVAFRKNALKYHPDVSKGIKGSEESFRSLLIAYETLVDPRARRDYMNAKGKGGDYDFNHNPHIKADPGFKKWRKQPKNDKRGSAQIWDLDEMRKAFDEEFTEAWEMAKHGPGFVADNLDDFPLEFEMEIVNGYGPDFNFKLNPSAVPLIEIVCGRQSLGNIIVPVSGVLDGKSTEFLTENQKIDKKKENNDKNESNINIETDFDLENNRLHLTWLGQPYANAWRVDDREYGMRDIYIKHANSGDLIATYKGYEDANSLGAIMDADGELTHNVLSYYTPGVQHISIVNTETGQLSCLCQRAWLPPSPWWIFTPRDSRYSHGGWYIQRNPKQTELHAVVPVLLSAFRSLDHARAGKIGNSADTVARMKSLTTKILGKRRHVPPMAWGFIGVSALTFLKLILF
jgi:hypothetical protein